MSSVSARVAERKAEIAYSDACEKVRGRLQEAAISSDPRDIALPAIAVTDELGSMVIGAGGRFFNHDLESNGHF